MTDSASFKNANAKAANLEMLPDTRRWTVPALVAVVIGALLSAKVWSEDQSVLLGGYLNAWLCLLEVVLGLHVLRWLNNLTGGAWGKPLRLYSAAARPLLLLAAILFVPIALNLPAIYEWANPASASDPIIAKKRLYLNVEAFQIRAVVYFAGWLLLDLWIRALERRALRDPSEPNERKVRMRSAQALLFYGLSMTFGSVDWAMSLEPHWYSAAYGVIAVIGQGLAAIAFTALLTARKERQEEFAHPELAAAAHKPDARHHHPGHRGAKDHDTHHPTLLQDLGNLMLAFTMLFTYTSFSQYLIIWFGDLPEEVVWYVHRFEHGWQCVAAGLLAFHFALPFVALLPRGVKRNPRAMTIIASWILFMRWLDGVWKVGPAFHASAAAGYGAGATLLAYAGPGLLMAGLFALLMAWLLPRQAEIVEIAYGSRSGREAHA